MECSVVLLAMRRSFSKSIFFLVKLYIISLFLAPLIQSALALDEQFELYRAPQATAMGDAFTADASGYASNYYNPAGLASVTKKTKEVTLVDFEGTLGFNEIQLGAKEGITYGIYRLFGPMKKNPGSYTYFNFSSVPAFSVRGFSFSLIGAYEYAGLSDGTNLDIQAREDVGATVGFARHFAGNVLKLGIAAKGIVRNQIKGVYSHAMLAAMNDDSFPTLFKEGLGIGADLGMIITIPSRWLPTLGVAWKDIFGTHFSKTNLLNKQASGTPDAIQQTVNAAVSLHPYFSRTFKGTIALEWKHVENSAMQWRKHLHFGIQLEDERSLYFWFGLNQLYPTGGIGLRVKGGNLEAGTYAEDVGVGPQNKEDRRLMFRYTIGF